MLRSSLLPVAAALLALLAAAAPTAAQSVRGQVLDEDARSPVSGISVSLVDAAGNRIATVISDANGRFVLLSRTPGEFRIRTSHIGYRDVTTPAFLLRSDEQVVVDVRVKTTALALEPLTIHARRPDPKYDATEEGFYARRLLAKPIGTARVMLPHDPEMYGSSMVEDVIRWLPRQRGCYTVWWNGNLVNDSVVARGFIELTPVDQLEGMEFYRTPLEAPAVFRELPTYLGFENSFCTVFVLWPRTGRFASEYVPPFPRSQLWDVQFASGVYHLSGRFAPGFGSGLEATTSTDLRPSLALTLNVRATAHQLAEQQSYDMTVGLSDQIYVLPPGPRLLQLWTAGPGVRLTVLRRPRMHATLDARAQLALRRFNMQSANVGHRNMPVYSFGVGGGGGIGVQWEVSPRLSANVAWAQDLYRFMSYSEIERTLTPTAAAWLSSGVRFGVTWHRGR